MEPEQIGTRQSQVMTQTDIMKKLIERLSKEIQNLDGRLTTILNSQPSGKVENSKTPKAQLVPLAETLSVMGMHLENLIVHVQSINQRLEI